MGVTRARIGSHEQLFGRTAGRHGPSKIQAAERPEAKGNCISDTLFVV